MSQILNGNMRAIQPHLIFAMTLLVFTGINACQETVEPYTPADDLAYWPLRPGNEWIYDQVEIRYEISGFDTTRTEVREAVIDVDTPTVDGYRYTLERSSRQPGLTDWTVDSVYYVRQSGDWLQTQIGNLTVMTLSFPVVRDRQWDYNSPNTRPKQLVYYQSDDDLPRPPFEDLPIPLGAGMRVIIADIPQNIVNQNEQYELYVKNIGLIEKKSIVLEYCTVGCDSAGQIDTGHYLLKQLKSYVVN